MAPVSLECTRVGCDLGADGAKYKTPGYEIEHAMENGDTEDAHGESCGPCGTATTDWRGWA